MLFFISGKSFGEVEKTFYKLYEDFKIESITLVTPNIYESLIEDAKKEIDNEYREDYLEQRLYKIIIA